MFPFWWLLFLSENQLIGKEASIPEGFDLTGEGAELMFYNAVESEEETKDFYPGIIVSADGFIPIGCDLSGSGNPYFINTNDGANGPLYRVYHDAVREVSYDADRAIAKVLFSYIDILDFVDRE